MSNPTTDVDIYDGRDDDTKPSDVAALERRIQGVGKASTLYSTLPGETFEDRLQNVATFTNSVALADQGQLTIQLRNVIIQSITMPDQKTGEPRAVPRILLVDEDGQAYHAISEVMLGSLEVLFGLVGPPEAWPSAIPTRMEKVKASQGNAFTLVFG